MRQSLPPDGSTDDSDTLADQLARKRAQQSLTTERGQGPPLSALPREVQSQAVPPSPYDMGQAAPMGPMMGPMGRGGSASPMGGGQSPQGPGASPGATSHPPMAGPRQGPATRPLVNAFAQASGQQQPQAPGSPAQPNVPMSSVMRELGGSPGISDIRPTPGPNPGQTMQTGRELRAAPPTLPGRRGPGKMVR